jgi:6-phosphogluconolactonase
MTARWALAPLLLAAAGCKKQPADPAPLVYIGGVPAAGASSRDITIYRLDRASGHLTAIASAPGAQRPSFLAFHPGGRFLYAVDEVDAGKVVAWTIDPHTGALNLLGRASAGGFGPCHIAVDRSGRWALTASWANTNRASVAVVPIQPDGRVTEPVERKDFQPMGHAHYITTSPDNRFVLANINGEQATAIYRFDVETGKLTPADPPRITFPAGYGPRHLDFHPNGRFVYVIHEQGSKITAHTWDATAGRLTQLQEVPTLPEGFPGENNRTAHVLVHPSGRFLFGSNRGHDSLVIFQIDPASGRLTFVAHQTGVGARPRNFTIDPSGTLLLVASQDEGTLRTYRVDRQSGRLHPLGDPQPAGPRPTFVGFLPSPAR